jgi:hypothetical protein
VPTIAASVSWDTRAQWPVRCVWVAVTSQQQQTSVQPFVAGVEQLVDHRGVEWLTIDK